MHDKTISPVHPFLLLLCFAAGAVSAFSMGDLLPSVRYVLTPRTVSLSGLALELLVWFLAGLTCCARPVFALTTLLRGCIFGLVLSLFADSAIAGGSIPVLAGYVLITLVLILFASGIRQWGIRYGIRFLVCAGAAMSIILFTN